MTDSRFTGPQLRSLAQVRANIAASGEAAKYHELGQSVADHLRKDYPDLSDETLGHLMANIATYTRKFADQSPQHPTGVLSVVFAAAAIDLASLELEGVPDA
jgi:hypothetical protein